MIAPDGKVVTCEMSPQDGDFVVGDCTHQTIMEVWNSEELKQWWNPPRSRFNGMPCDDCPEFHDCIVATGQCWFRAFSAYGTPYAPHPDCRRTKTFQTMGMSGPTAVAECPGAEPDLIAVVRFGGGVGALV